MQGGDTASFAMLQSALEWRAPTAHVLAWGSSAGLRPPKTRRAYTNQAPKGSRASLLWPTSTRTQPTKLESNQTTWRAYTNQAPKGSRASLLWPTSTRTQPTKLESNQTTWRWSGRIRFAAEHMLTHQWLEPGSRDSKCGAGPPDNMSTPPYSIDPGSAPDQEYSSGLNQAIAGR